MRAASSRAPLAALAGALALSVAGLAALAAGCPGERAPAPPPPAPAAPAAPRLVVLVVIDQLPAWAFEPRAAAAEDGVARLLRDGRWWTSRAPHAATQTAPGHASLGTGAPPAVHGILGNEWWRRDAGRVVRATEGPDGASPAWLEAEAIGEALARARPDARAAAVSLKDRGAILVLGRAGRQVWYDDACPCFVSPGAPAPWLDDLAAAHPIAPRLGEVWTPADPARLARLSGSPDDAPGELGIPGWDATFPHDPAATARPARALVNTPLGNQIVVEAALAAVRGEGLGGDDVPDLLVVSFSGYDYTAHAWGQDSWEAWDAWLRLDRQLGDLLRGLDDAVGAGRWALVLTSDHGAVELPERRRARGLPAARTSYEAIQAVAEAAAAEAAGPGGPWIASARYPTIYLTAAANALAPDARDRVIDAVVAAVAAIPGIDRADRAADLTGGCDARDGDARAICLALHPTGSGEVFYAPAEGTVLHPARWVDAVSHGSLHAYDRDVPVIVVAPGVAPGRDDEVVSALRVAPTLAALLGIPPPARADAPALAALPGR